jgi:hypothetical protein
MTEERKRVQRDGEDGEGLPLGRVLKGFPDEEEVRETTVFRPWNSLRGKEQREKTWRQHRRFERS